MSNNRTCRTGTVAAIAAVAAALTGVGTTGAAATTAAASSVAPAAPVVKVTVTNHAIRFHGGTHLHAGRYVFAVHAPKGDHTVQIVRLHKGYTAAQYQKDVNASVQSDGPPDLAAVRRLDHRVTWLGGAESGHRQTNEFAAVLAAGHYLVVDQDGPAATRLTVTGKTRSASVPVEATVTGTRHDTWKSPKTLPAHGWIRLRDTSDEAHVFVAMKVKRSTTNAKVRRFVRQVASGKQRQPSWQLKPSTDSGLISRRTNVDLHLDLPKGKYLVICFWPSKDSGMPHFLMGMWKLVNLR